MKKVSRSSKPDSLERKASEWTQELLTKIAECQEAPISKVPEKFYEKYRKTDIKKSLCRMYNNFCCYCESRIGVVEYGHIEHRKPTKKFPEHTYDWENLHLSCTRCNQTKVDKYDERHPILDAAVDDPAEHLTYKIVGPLLWCWPLSKRGDTTVSHTGMNDNEGLCDAWVTMFFASLKAIGKINKNPRSHDARVRKQELLKMCDGEYGSVIAFAMDTYMNQ